MPKLHLPMEALVCTNQLQSQITLWRHLRQFGEVSDTNTRQCSSLLGAKTNYDMHRTDSARRTRLPSIECIFNFIAHPGVGLLVS